MSVYRLGTTYENHLGPPSPNEIKRQPEESLEEFSARILEGIPLSTWAVITIGRGWKDVRPVLDEAKAREDARSMKEYEDRGRRLSFRGPEKEFHLFQVEYLELSSVEIAGNYVEGEPPKEE